jgi:hypothetical protein
MTDELAARGLKTVTSVGMCLMRARTSAGRSREDRLWFFYSHRDWGNERAAASKYYNLTQHAVLHPRLEPAGRQSNSTSPTPHG